MITVLPNWVVSELVEGGAVGEGLHMEMIEHDLEVHVLLVHPLVFASRNSAAVSEPGLQVP